jgi:hypothetical protein
MVISLLLITFLLAVAAFWPYLVAWFDEWRRAAVSCWNQRRGPTSTNPQSGYRK